MMEHKVVFELFQKLHPQICPFESGKCEKRRFLDEITFFEDFRFFVVFEGLSFDGKIKI